MIKTRKALFASTMAITLLAGCGPKSQLRGDPFAGMPKSTGTPRFGFFNRGSTAASRDPAPRSTREPDDKFIDPIPGAPRGQQENTRPSSGNIFDDEGSSPSRAVSKGDSPAEKTLSNVAGNVDLAGVRSRLDKAGAKNFFIQSDAASGETVFRCEIDNPRDGSKVKVFEARDKDQVAAMQEVVLAIENWQDRGSP